MLQSAGLPVTGGASMTEPSWPEWGAHPDREYPWHTYKGPQGDLHAGHLLDTVVGPDVVTGKPIVYEVLRCTSCIGIHVTPLPTQEALSHYYASQFYQQDKPDYVERYERDRRWWEQCVHQPILKQAMRILDAALPTKVDRYAMLDIGAGPGIALDVGKRLRLDTWGIEPNPTLVDALRLRGHSCFTGTLESCNAEWYGAYHIIYLYEVLEHQPQPEDFLLRCYEMLAPGGVLVCVVPNDYNPLQRQACAMHGLPPYWLAPPQHLWYWTPKMLQLQLRRVGFRLLDMRGTFPLELYMIEDGLVYVGNDALGRECHKARMYDELYDEDEGKLDERFAHYRSHLALYREGREIVAIARKA